MALVNFTTPFGGILPVQSWTTISPLQRHATSINNMLYGPAGHQQPQEDDPDYDYDYKNEPYAPPTINRQTYQPQPHQYRRPNDYLPPATPRQTQTRRPPQHLQQNHLNNINGPDYPSLYTTRSIGASIEPQPKIAMPQNKPLQPPLKQPQYNDHFSENDYKVRRVTNYPQSQDTSSIEQPTDHIATQPTVAPQNIHSRNHQQRAGVSNSVPNRDHHSQDQNVESDRSTLQSDGFPSQPATFTRVQSGTGSNTNVHAILDYDEEEGDDYYDENNGDVREGKEHIDVTL